MDIDVNINTIFGFHKDPLNILKDPAAFAEIYERLRRDLASDDEMTVLDAARDYFSLYEALAPEMAALSRRSKTTR
jgi:hypothetical protein